NKLYIKAITEYITQHNLHLDRFVKPNKDSENLYIFWMDILVDLPKTIEGYNIILVSKRNQKQIYKTHGKRLVVLKISPLTFENSKFYVNVEENESFQTSKNNFETKQLGMWTTSFFNFINGEMIFENATLSGLYKPRTKQAK
ncbi:hypothetical protein, partial [Flavobacterium longum]|uniref:hypothetical protein n=1 Tax=Flavobacterium longum TaxID=1299340 RepID=UPI0039ECE5F8